MPISIKQPLKNLPNNPLFSWFQNISKLSNKEMLSTFNCGIGMVLIISKKDLKKLEKLLKKEREDFFIIGEVTKNTNNGERCVII